jgi:hypothetical protein
MRKYNLYILKRVKGGVKGSEGSRITAI